jgi:hypothetical protein
LRAFQRDARRSGARRRRSAADPTRVETRIASLRIEHKKLTRELQQARMKAALAGGGSSHAPESMAVAGVTLVAQEVSGLDKSGPSRAGRSAPRPDQERRRGAGVSRRREGCGGRRRDAGI